MNLIDDQGSSTELARRPRRLLVGVVAGMTAAAVGVLVSAEQRDRDSVVANSPAEARSVQEEPWVTDQAPDGPVGPLTWKAGSKVPITDWINRYAGLAVTRSPVSGIAIYAEATDNSSAPKVRFSTDGANAFSIAAPSGDLVASNGVKTVDYSAARQRLTVFESDGTEAGDAEITGPHRHGDLQFLPNNDLDRVLHPSRWIETMAATNEVEITYLGPVEHDGRIADRFQVQFPGLAKVYSADGWLLDVDAESGALLYHRIATADGAVDEMSLRFNPKWADPLDTFVVPAGTVSQRLVTGDTEPAPQVTLKTDQPASELLVAGRVDR